MAPAAIWTLGLKHFGLLRPTAAASSSSANFPDGQAQAW